MIFGATDDERPARGGGPGGGGTSGESWALAPVIYTMHACMCMGIVTYIRGMHTHA